MSKIAVLILILLTSLTTVFAIVQFDLKPPLPLKNATQAVLELEIKQGFEEIQEVNIYYREIKKEAYIQVRLADASAANPIYNALLPALLPNSEGYEYYFEITRLDGQVQTAPDLAPQNNPYRLIQEMTVQGESDFVILTPTSNVVYNNEDFVLVISTFSIADKLDSLSIKIMANGVDVTSSANITSNLIVYRQPKPKIGDINIQVSGKTKDGIDIAIPPMIYTVKKSNLLLSLPFNLWGNISFNSNVISISAQDSSSVTGFRSNDASTDFYLYGGQGWFKFNTKAFFSSLENKSQQPVDRYSLGLYVPSMDLILGDNTPYFNSLTLNSTNVRGIYARLYSKGFELIGMYGQSKRSIDGKEYVSASTKAGTFARDASALRLQFGSMNSFQWSLNIAKSRDIVSSLPPKYYQIVNGTGADADTTQLAYPTDNLVLGTDMRLSLFHQNFIFGIEGAGSLYNSNILPGPISSDDIEKYLGSSIPLGIKPSDFQDIFVLNKNMEPFLPSIANVAMQGYARLFFLKNYLSINYSQVGASFNSVAANYLQNDTRTINFSDNINIRNIAFLDGGLNIISDNLSEQKSSTSTYNTIYIQSLFRLNRLPYLRIGYRTSTGKNKKNTENISSTFNPMDTENNVMDIGMGYDFIMMPVAPTKLDLTYNSGTDEDKLNSAYELNSNNVLVTLTSKFQEIPLLTRISFNTALQDSKTELTTGTANKINTSNTDFGLHGEYQLLDEKLTPFADFKTTVLGGDQNKQAYQLINLGARYFPLEQTTISTNLGFKSYSNSSKNNCDYNSVSWNLSLSQRF